ncbi:MAG TPA: pyruvate, phosphate dikinase [Candidatus Dormibacteraeota bacterium]|nr:pyruvate, phosphate dikinase [Candidatus Dormibacteraeota bacterium]
MRFVYALDSKHTLPANELVALIGGKAANLALMTTELGLPVPPGFAITTEACRTYLAKGWPQGLDDELTAAMRKLEDAVGRRFGDPQNPLLVSVRSGAPVSMPGMMDTILNLGLNDETTRGLAEVSGDAEFAADCRRRLEEMFTQIVGVTTVPDDPWHQLRSAVEAVFRSWNSDRATAYRSHERIPDDLGTAVTVQAMVFGNWRTDSATGVLFTRNPATGEPALYGDVLFASQGEDVVAGTHQTQPLTVLDEQLPRVGAELRQFADSLERHFADLCDIEFTIERGKLWLLQVRVGKRSPRAALRIAVDMADAADFPLTRAQAVERVASLLTHPPTVTTGRSSDVAPLATGLPASPGVATGEIATSPAAAVAAADAGRAVILVRSETSPDDVQGMARAVGVLTSRGGLASHAAVVARGWGIPAVVGAETVKVGDGVVDVAGHTLKAGETITIDGETGEIFAGAVPRTTAVVPEAAKLQAWAAELGIAISESPPPPGGGLGRGAAELAVTSEDIVRALLIKGSATNEGLAESLMSTPDLARTMLEGLVGEGLVQQAAGAFRLTPSGTTKANARIAADQLRWGTEQARAALDAFHVLDLRVKNAVTAWQLREVGGAQTLNDHTDAGYDAGVLEQLAGVQRDTAGWLSSQGEAPAELRRYLSRLERALAQARDGDQRFVASPRVDSYHGVWFELHEELILLAGRSRAEEAAAGRA